MLSRLLEVERRFEEIEGQLMDPEITKNPKELQRLGKARSGLEDVVGVIRRYKSILQGIDDSEELVRDPEMKELAQEELDQLKEEKVQVEEQLKIMLLPKDPNDDKSVIVEVRPAAGGDEAALFANEIYRMYVRYAERRRWKVEEIDFEESGLGGASRVVFSIVGHGAYSQLKHESGVHRVQRVPATESQGRIHTSTITVAVLPEVEEVDVDIKADDLEVSSFRSSSAGGQHMQKNDTAVRIIHKPSGIVVTCQDERSQAQNKEKAMTVLRAKLYEMEQEKLAKERGELRRGQIGSGDRSEKIRTYNYSRDQVMDHRIGFEVFGIPTFLAGDLQKMIDALIQADQAAKLAAAEESLVG